MKKIIFVLMLSILSATSVFASDHNLKTSYPWKVSFGVDQSFAVPRIMSGFFVVTIYNKGPDKIDVGPNHAQNYTGCSKVSSGSSCAITFYPTGTPAKPFIYDGHVTSPPYDYAVGTIDMTYYP